MEAFGSRATAVFQPDLTFISSFRIFPVISVIITQLKTNPDTIKNWFSSNLFASFVRDFPSESLAFPPLPPLMNEWADAPMNVYMRYKGNEAIFATENEYKSIAVVPHI